MRIVKIEVRGRKIAFDLDGHVLGLHREFPDARQPERERRAIVLMMRPSGSRILHLQLPEGRGEAENTQGGVLEHGDLAGGKTRIVVQRPSAGETFVEIGIDWRNEHGTGNAGPGSPILANYATGGSCG